MANRERFTRCGAAVLWCSGKTLVVIALLGVSVAQAQPSSVTLPGPTPSSPVASDAAQPEGARPRAERPDAVAPRAAVPNVAAEEEREGASRAGMPATEHARRRLAFVIGNASYRPALRNPLNDARGVSAALSSIGWEVTEVEDTKAVDLQGLIAQFAERVVPDDEVVFYYSGHGVQLDGENFLLPVDATFTTDNDVRLNALSLTNLLETLDARHPHTLIVMLDACRDNPFPSSFHPASRGGLKKGLAAIESPPARSLIAFAASEGKTASDGIGAYGTFTQALLEQLGRPYVSAIEVLTEVNRSVRERTEDAQVPEIRLTLDYPFRFNPQPAPPPKVRALSGGKVQTTFLAETVTHTLVALGTLNQVENLARKAAATSVEHWREVFDEDMIQLNGALRGLAAVDAAARECDGPEFAADARRLQNAHATIINAIDALELHLAQELSSGAIDDTPGACIATDWQRIGLYSAAGVGVAGVALGGALLYYANDTWNEALEACPGNADGSCPDERGPRLSRLARERADLATGAFIVGGVGLGTALGLWLYESLPSNQAESGPEAPALSVRISGSDRGLKVNVGGTF